MAPKSSITVHYRTPEANKNCYTVKVYDQHILATVTKNPDVVTEWINGVTKHTTLRRVVGFEIEFDFSSGRIGTLQLCVGNRCLVFQLPPDLPPSLVEFLGSEINTFVSTQMESKIALLRAQFPFDVGVKNVELGQKAPFLRDLKHTELAALMEMGVVETDWDRLPYKLSHHQVHYACLHAFLNLHVF